MDPIIDAFTARYLGVPLDEYLHVSRGPSGRRVPCRPVAGSPRATARCFADRNCAVAS